MTERCVGCDEPFTTERPAVEKPIHDGMAQTHADCDPLARAEKIVIPANFAPERHSDVRQRLDEGARIGRIDALSHDSMMWSVFIIPATSH